MRSLMVAPPDTIMAYLDWRTQEIGIAAALSGDPELIHDYSAGDVYHGLALSSGFTTDPDVAHWKKTQPDMRQRMKSLQLAINYGMGVSSLSSGLNRHPLIGSTIIEKHKRRHATFWAWRDAQVQGAMLERRIESVYGWPLYISTSPNKRTLYNFPMQANGAEMLRLSAWRLCEAGIVPSMLVHDAILLEVKSEEQIAHAAEIMRQAGRDVCNGFEIGVDIDQIRESGARYQDKRDVAKEMWATIMDVLTTIGALPKREVA
jgi:DNA polymerase I-like protein with 3'-5' exonuclease and polymerase domains